MSDSKCGMRVSVAVKYENCYYAPMIRDVVRFREFWTRLRGKNAGSQGISMVVGYLERKLGGEFIYDIECLPYPYLELADLFELAAKLQEKGVITGFWPERSPVDEPRLFHWHAMCGNAKRNNCAGASLTNDHDALLKALAEANERYLWYERLDFKTHMQVAALQDMSEADTLLPHRFSGFNEAIRAKEPRLHLQPTSNFTWIKGYSWSDKKPVWIPLRTVSGYRGKIAEDHIVADEPMIRPTMTNGLASQSTQSKALLAGACEVLERDAWIVTWLNQISAPKLDLEALQAESESFREVISRLKRYRLTPHIIRLLSDAPVFALCAVLEDESGIAPRFSFGLKAGRDPAKTAEGAIVEALRSHRGTRNNWAAQDLDPEKPVRDIGHFERLTYWAQGTNHKKLEFFIRGTTETRRPEIFEKDTDEEYLERITRWCRDKKYAFASVSFTGSNANITPWHIESVVIPELQPAHLIERYPSAYGPRVHEVPSALGYAPRKSPFLDAPHPFA